MLDGEDHQHDGRAQAEVALMRSVRPVEMKPRSRIVSCQVSTGASGA